MNECTSVIMFRKTGKILMSEKLSNFRGVGKTVRGRLKAAIQNLFSYLKNWHRFTLFGFHS